MREQGPEEWPDLLLMLGDQVYADEDAPKTRAFIRERRGTDGAARRWRTSRSTRTSTARAGARRRSDGSSTVPSAMIFDDHDIHDDWNTSISWLEEMRRKPGGTAQITGGLVGYWVLAPQRPRRRRSGRGLSER